MHHAPKVIMGAAQYEDESSMARYPATTAIACGPPADARACRTSDGERTGTERYAAGKTVASGDATPGADGEGESGSAVAADTLEMDDGDAVATTSCAGFGPSSPPPTIVARRATGAMKPAPRRRRRSGDRE
jgi:hypothetical protein